MEEDLLRLVSILNDQCFRQTEASGQMLLPFQYLTDGESWVIQFLGQPMISSEDEEVIPGMSYEELKTLVIETVEDYLKTIRLIKLTA